MNYPTQAQIDARLDTIVEEMEAGAGPAAVVREHWREAFAGGWLTRLRSTCWAFDGGTFDNALLDRLLPELDALARRAPDAGLES